MSTYNIIAASNESTVVAEYTPESARSDSFQSEAALEKEFIRLLCEQGYEYLSVHDESGLIANLRRQLEVLNSYTFTDSEWKRFFSETLANANEGIVEKTRTIQTDHVKVLRRDDGSSKNIQLIDKKNVHNNHLQVINQYEVSSSEGAAHDNRYDVTILVNGLPLVHVELKRRGVAIREAFNQIKRYQRDSFWAASGLYEYVQIFIISNGTHTKYYSNTTRNSHIKEMDEASKQKSKKTSNSFEFTSFWADGNNKVIITTIQKLDNFVSKNKEHVVFSKHCVIIFDECHRSQFGDMHAKIVKAFKNYHLFGFTGTPIFAANAGKGKHLAMLTTPQTFGDQLHTYTIVDAINDGNVLPFRIDYVNTVKEKENIKDKDVSAIDIERAMGAPERIREIVKYTLVHLTGHPAIFWKARLETIMRHSTPTSTHPPISSRTTTRICPCG